MIGAQIEANDARLMGRSQRPMYIFCNITGMSYVFSYSINTFG
jgi:hypothetical protein